jgi:hypothetical protein
MLPQKRVGPVCDAPNVVPILANDVPGFLWNTKISSILQNGKTARLEQNCTVSSRAYNRDGVQTCFGSKYCQQVGERRSHVFGGCAVRFEDLQAACANLLDAKAGGACLGCSVCEGACKCEHGDAASLNLERGVARTYGFRTS